MKKYNVGIIGATEWWDSSFATLLENHPWFTVSALAASSRSAGKKYEDAVAALGNGHSYSRKYEGYGAF